MSEELAFKDCSHEFSESTIERGAIKVLTSKMALKIYCRSSSKYLAIENVIKGVAKSSKMRLEEKLKTEDYFNLSISILIRKEA